jgi:hypothetical protein
LLKNPIAVIPPPFRRSGKESAVSAAFCEAQMPGFARRDTLAGVFQQAVGNQPEPRNPCNLRDFLALFAARAQLFWAQRV